VDQVLKSKRKMVQEGENNSSLSLTVVWFCIISAVALLMGTWQKGDLQKVPLVEFSVGSLVWLAYFTFMGKRLFADGMGIPNLMMVALGLRLLIAIANPGSTAGSEVLWVHYCFTGWVALLWLMLTAMTILITYIRLFGLMVKKDNQFKTK
jgi:hypothetical protein